MFPEPATRGRRAKRQKVRVVDSSVGSEVGGKAKRVRSRYHARLALAGHEELVPVLVQFDSAAGRIIDPHAVALLKQTREVAGKAKTRRQPPPPRPHATAAEVDFRHRGWWGRREKTRRIMELAHMPPARLERFDHCGAYARMLKDASSEQYRIHASYCHDRYCVPCSVARSLQIADNLTERLCNSEEQFRHVVLTLKHRDEPLADQVDRLFKCFRRLRSRKDWVAHFAGGAYFLQAHVSDADKLWHVHLHIIAQGGDMPHHLLSGLWLKITGDSSNVHLTRITPRHAGRTDAETQRETVRRVALEVSRYAAKPIPSTILDDDDRAIELMRALNGRHLCSTFGVWRDMRITARRLPDPSKVWLDVGAVTDWVLRAQAGDDVARRVLRSLTRREHPALAPPTLWDLPRDLSPGQAAAGGTPAKG